MANNITLNDVTISLRADTLANWQIAQTAAGNSPIIASGEVVVVTDTFRIIRGDGVSKFETLYNSPLTYPTIHCNSKPTAGVVDGALYIDVTNNKFYLGTSSGAVEMSFTLNAASSTALGGIKIGYGVNGRNYPVQLNNSHQAFVNVPWENTTYNAATENANGLMSKEDKTKLNNIEEGANNYTLPVATDGARGGIKVGYSTSGKNYAVQLENEKAYVNVPWTDTTYSEATDTTLGLIKTGYTKSGKNYPVKLSNGNAYVNVPWENSTRKLVVASAADKLANEAVSGTNSNTLYINLVKDGNTVESYFSIKDGTTDTTKRLFNITSDGQGGISLTPNTTYITNEFSSLQQQINEARDIAQGKTNTWVFDAEAPSDGFPSWLEAESDIYKVYYNMISTLIAHSPMIGEDSNIIKFSDNLLLLPVDTPDFWVSGTGLPGVDFTDIDSVGIINTNSQQNIVKLIDFANSNAPYIYIGNDASYIYRISKLETRKVDLTPYQKELMDSPLGEDENGEPIGAYVEPAIHYINNLLATTRNSLHSLTSLVNTISGDLTGVMESMGNVLGRLTTIDETLDEHTSDISGLQIDVHNLTNEDMALAEKIEILRTTINNNAAADNALAGRVITLEGRVTTLENTVVYKTDTITISGGGAAR